MEWDGFILHFAVSLNHPKQSHQGTPGCAEGALDLNEAVKKLGEGKQLHWDDPKGAGTLVSLCYYEQLH